MAQNPVADSAAPAASARLSASSHGACAGYPHLRAQAVVEQGVQPLRVGALFEHDRDPAAHAADELEDRTLLRGQDGVGQRTAARVLHQRHDGCLVNVEGDILIRPIHESRSLV